jgi:hypothetical protein
MRKKYHYQKGFPKVTFPSGTFPLTYSEHAIIESKSDKFGKFKLPEFIDTETATVIEIETKDSKIDKLLYRLKLDRSRDLCLAIKPFAAGWLVKTVWLTYRKNHHSNLKLSNYDDP